MVFLARVWDFTPGEERRAAGSYFSRRKFRVLHREARADPIAVMVRTSARLAGQLQR